MYNTTTEPTGYIKAYRIRCFTPRYWESHHHSIPDPDTIPQRKSGHEPGRKGALINATTGASSKTSGKKKRIVEKVAV